MSTRQTSGLLAETFVADMLLRIPAVEDDAFLTSRDAADSFGGRTNPVRAYDSCR